MRHRDGGQRRLTAEVGRSLLCVALGRSWMLPWGNLRKLRGKDLVIKPGRTRHYQVPAARTIAALLTLRDHIIAPILAGVRSPRRGRKPSTWTTIDRDYETLRVGMHTLFDHLGISIDVAAA